MNFDYMGCFDTKFEDLLAEKNAYRMRDDLFATLKLKCFPCKFSTVCFRNQNFYYSYDLLNEYFKKRFMNETKNNIKFDMEEFPSESETFELIREKLIVSVENIFDKDNVKFVTKQSNFEYKKTYRTFRTLNIYFRPEVEENVDEIIENLMKFKMINDEENCVHMICLAIDEDDEKYLHLEPIKIRNPNISDLDLQYGQNFKEFHKNLMENLLKENAHGLVLLHGAPGILFVIFF